MRRKMEITTWIKRVNKIKEMVGGGKSPKMPFNTKYIPSIYGEDGELVRQSLVGIAISNASRQFL